MSQAQTPAAGAQNGAGNAPQAPRTPTPTEKAGTTVRAARDVVTVACKLPNGIILREFRQGSRAEAVLGGGTRDVTVHEPTGDQVVVLGIGGKAGEPPPILVNGYRYTRNVPARIWDQWLAANRTSDMVTNGLVYAADRSDYLKDWSRAHEGTRSGLEGIDPNAPGKRVRGIERADRPRPGI